MECTFGNFYYFFQVFHHNFTKSGIYFVKSGKRFTNFCLEMQNT